MRKNRLSMRQYMNRSRGCECKNTNQMNKMDMNFKNVSEGDIGEEVEKIQMMLLDLAHVYPEILVITIDGNFGSNTKTAVLEFQKSVGLIQTGIVDLVTFNKMKKIHSERFEEIRKIENEHREDEDSLDLSNNVIKEGSTGRYVVTLQQYINAIASVHPSILALKVDGIFGPKTKNSVFEFQKLFNLPIDGIVGEQTWEKLYEEFKKAMDEIY